MPDFGQSISPKIYRDTTGHVVSRWELCQLLDSALRAVGMLPIRAMSFPGYPAELAATYPETQGTRSDMMWFYSFPDTSAFTLNGVAYVPVVGLYFPCSVNMDPNNNYLTNGFGFKLCVLPQASLTRGSLRNLENIHIDGTNYGFGSYSNSPATHYQGQKGAFYMAPSVKASPNANAFSTQTLDSVKTIQVSLTKAGLWIFAGSGTRKTDMANKFAVGFAFMGSRVPGRALDPSLDPYLTCACPVVMLPLLGSMQGETDRYWNSTDSGPLTWGLGFQYNSSLFTANAVQMKIYAVENMEASIYPKFSTPPIASPKKIDGQDRHVLQHMVVVPYVVYNTSTPVYGRTDAGGQPATPWSEVFYLPGVAMSDSTLPAGDHVDPVSSKTWFTVTYPRNNQTIAIDITGAVAVTNPSAQTLTEDIYMSFVNGVTGPYPKPSSVVAGTPARWTTTAGQDEMLGTVGNAATPQLVTFDVTLTGIQATSRIIVSFDMRVRSANPQQPADFGYYEQSTDGGTTWERLLSLVDAGTNTSAPSYNYQTFTFELSAINGHAMFRFGSHNPNYSGLMTNYIRNLHIKRYDG